MKSQSPPKSQKGFTLIEVMVVIVIMTIMTSLVVLNIGGVDQKKAMQARELFLLDAHKIGKESLDQSRVLALSTMSETDVSPFSYELYEYHDQSKLQVQDLKTVGRNTQNLLRANCLNMYRLQYNL